MLDVLFVLGTVWLLAHLTQRFLIKGAGVFTSLLVAFAFALLAPILHLFLVVIGAALLDTAFDPENWFRQIPLFAASSAVIAYVIVRTKTKPPGDDDDHMERKL